MDDLAAELGMSKKTLYVHFPNKTALLEEVFRDKFGSLDADLARITSVRSKDFMEALHESLACMQRHTREVQLPFVRDVQRESPELFQSAQAQRAQVIQRHFTSLLLAGRKVGIIRRDIPLKLAIEILLGATQAIMNPQKIEELSLTPKSGFSAIITVFLEGMITAKEKLKR